jgi:hypothetical protein
MKPAMAFQGLLLAGMAIFGMPAWTRADELPPPPPAAGDIKACIRQMDTGEHWSFDWKLLEIGTARHPRNSYEALYAPAGAGSSTLYGYPVHVVFSLNGHPDIDAVYWLIRDANGHWQIPAICTVR